MVLQYPQLRSSEILEYDEAPLDLSVSNRTRCPSPPRSPECYRDTMSPDYHEDSHYRDERVEDDYRDDYRVEDYKERLQVDDYRISYNSRDTLSPQSVSMSPQSHDSDDSDSQRGVPHNPKAYKKAIMKRYLDTDSSRVVSPHYDSHHYSHHHHHHHNSSSRHQQQQQQQQQQHQRGDRKSTR